MELKKARILIHVTLRPEVRQIAESAFQGREKDTWFLKELIDAQLLAETNALEKFFPAGRKKAPGLSEPALRKEYLEQFRGRFFRSADQ